MAQITMPIFVNTTNATETFGITDVPNPVCGPACGYDAEKRRRFWGVAGSIVDLSILLQKA
jgi:hypothetical protein